MGRRSRRYRRDSFWTKVHGGMPMWLIISSAAVVLVAASVVSYAVMQRSSASAPRPAYTYTPAPKPTPEQAHRAVMWGDSYFNGWGTVKQEDALGAATARALGYVPILRGTGATGYVTQRGAEKKGGVAPSFIEQLAAEPLSDGIELVVVNGGLADRGADSAVFEAGMREMINSIRAQAPHARIVILGPPNVTPKVEESGMDGRQRAIAVSEGVDYISFDQIMAADELRPLISAEDRTHPVPEVVPEIVARLAEQLRNLGVADYAAG